MKSKTSATNVKSVAAEIFSRLGLKAKNAGVFAGEWFGSGPVIEKHSPIDGSLLAQITTATADDVRRVIGAAERAFAAWRNVPAPKRGEIVRRLGALLRSRRRDLGRL